MPAHAGEKETVGKAEATDLTGFPRKKQGPPIERRTVGVVTAGLERGRCPPGSGTQHLVIWGNSGLGSELYKGGGWGDSGLVEEFAV